jgi:hypothetical protein
MVSWGFRAMSRGLRAMSRSLRAMCRSFGTTRSFVRSPDVRRTLIDRLPAVSVGDSVRRGRSTAGSACGRSGRRRRHRLRGVSVSHPRIERVPGEGVGDAGRALALTPALGGAAGRDRGES